MKVARAPYALFIDQKLCELAIICGGMRMAMTGEEATAFWVEIGFALQRLYADRQERCPSVLAAFLMRQLADEERRSANQAPWAADPGLEGVIDYARRPLAPSKEAIEQKPPLSAPDEAPRPGESVLGRLVKEAFKMSKEKPRELG